MSRRYPLEALVTASGMSEAALARHVGLSGTTLKNARETGLREDAADRYAVRAGFSPLEVWPDYGFAICPECVTSFAPRRAGHVYCSRVCGNRRLQRERYRRRYASDPEFVQNERRRRMAFYEACGDYERARQRRYRAAKTGRGTSVEQSEASVSAGQSASLRDVAAGPHRRGGVAA